MMSFWFDRLLAGSRRRSYRQVAEAQAGLALARTCSFLILIFAAHSVAMVYFEGMSSGDAIWLTLTTATTVGYGDVSAGTLPGRLSTVVLLYAGGIFVLAKLAGDYFDFRSERRRRMSRGEWEWNMRDHIVIINVPQDDPVHYFSLLISQFRTSAEFSDTPVQIVTRAYTHGLPSALVDLGDVVHFNGNGEDDDSLRAAAVQDARAVIVLARSDNDPASDSVTFDILHRIRRLGTKGRVLAESVRDTNRERFVEAGADIVIRPIRAYPGMVVRGFVAPGAQALMEELFSSDGGEYRRLDVPIRNLKWAHVVSTIVSHDLGVALAYEDDEGKLHVSPRASEAVSARALFVVVDSQTKVMPERVAEALSALEC